MERSELQTAVAEVVAALLKTDADLDPAAALADHGLTSMQSVSLVMAVEDRFDIAIPDQALTLDNFATVDAIVDLVTPIMKAEDHA